MGSRSNIDIDFQLFDNCRKRPTWQTVTRTHHSNLSVCLSVYPIPSIYPPLYLCLGAMAGTMLYTYMIDLLNQTDELVKSL